LDRRFFVDFYKSAENDVLREADKQTELSGHMKICCRFHINNDHALESLTEEYRFKAAKLKL